MLGILKSKGIRTIHKEIQENNRKIECLLIQIIIKRKRKGPTTPNIVIVNLNVKRKNMMGGNINK